MASSMESDEDRELQNEEDMRGYDSKKRKLSSAQNEDQQKKERYTVGMVAVSRANGLFSDPHEVGTMLAAKVGEIRSVRTTRSGMVVIECMTLQQMKKVLRIDDWDGDNTVKCFRLGLGARARQKGVISGVPHSVLDLAFEKLEGVCEARRMMTRRAGEWEESMSICLTFEGELPERVYQDYVCYRVRPFQAAPLRCFCCQEYGHVAAVCRAQRRSCGNCGKAECVKRRCEKEQAKPKCLHCEGEHHAGSVKCPRRGRWIR